jgi:hypothetical protein
MGDRHERGSDRKPDWVPDWAPDPGTIDYISSGLTAALLVMVGTYLVFHLVAGRSAAGAATIGAGVGVGGAGT